LVDLFSYTLEQINLDHIWGDFLLLHFKSPDMAPTTFP
jgi:hypothetical protein